jgi:serine/threonine protein kinase
LADILKRGPLTAEQQKMIAVNMAQALAYLHAHNIPHREMKAEYIFFNERGVAQFAVFEPSVLIANKKNRSVNNVTVNIYYFGLMLSTFMASNKTEGILSTHHIPEWESIISDCFQKTRSCTAGFPFFTM